MARWADFEEQGPDLATTARGLLDAFVHKTIATIRRDGSPRISGTEVIFAEGELWFGSMWRSMKALDLLRDPRFALHSGSSDPPEWPGDAAVSGRAVEVSDAAVIDRIVGRQRPSGPLHLFRADLAAVSVVAVGDPPDHLVIHTWRAGSGLERRERR